MKEAEGKRKARPVDLPLALRELFDLSLEILDKECESPILLLLSKLSTIHTFVSTGDLALEVRDLGQSLALEDRDLALEAQDFALEHVVLALEARDLALEARDFSLEHDETAPDVLELFM